MQVTMSDAANAHSTEVLSEVSDNPPIHVPPIINDNPHTRTSDNMHTGFTEPFVSATQNLPVSLPAIPSRLQDKIISGEFIDFTSLLSKAMFLGPHYVEPSKFITVHLNPEKDDFSVHPTQPPRKITSFSTWMEAWNTYLAILIDHAPCPCTTIGCIPKDNNFSQQSVPTCSLVEL